MSDTSNTADQVIDLSADPNRMVRVAGFSDPIPASQLMSKAELTRSTQAYAKREQELREQFAEANGVLEALREDPVGFRDALSESLQESGMTARQANAEAGRMIEDLNSGGTPAMTMNDNGEWQAATQKIAALENHIQALQSIVFEKEANNAISSEVAQSRQQEREINALLSGDGKDLTDQGLKEVIAIANRDGVKNVTSAYKIWKHDQLVDSVRKLKDEVEVTKRKAALPWSGASEANIVSTQKKSAKEIFEEKLNRLSL